MARCSGTTGGSVSTHRSTRSSFSATRSRKLFDFGGLAVITALGLNERDTMSQPNENPDSDRMTVGEKRAIVIGITVPLLAGTAFALWLFVWRDTWEADHRQSILRLSVEAQSLEQAGRAEEAKQEYDSISAMIGERILHDEELATQARLARDGSAHLGERIVLKREREMRDRQDQDARLVIAQKAVAETERIEATDIARRNEEAKGRILEDQRRAEEIKREAEFDQLFSVSHSPVLVNVRDSKLKISYPIEKLYVAVSKFRFGDKPPVCVGGDQTRFFDVKVDGGNPVDLRFFKVSGVPEKITFTSDNPKVLAVRENGGVLALGPGKAIITITLAGADARIPILVEALPVGVPITTDELIKALGLPDHQEQVLFLWPDNGFVDGIFYATRPDHNATASHWRYKRFPNVVFVIRDSKFVDISNYK